MRVRLTYRDGQRLIARVTLEYTSLIPQLSALGVDYLLTPDGSMILPGEVTESMVERGLMTTYTVAGMERSLEITAKKG